MSEAKPFGRITNWTMVDFSGRKSSPCEIKVWPDPPCQPGMVPLFAKPFESEHAPSAVAGQQEPVGWIPDWSYEHLVGGTGDRHPIMFWPMPQDKTGLVPLFAKPVEFTPTQWTKEPPSVPGHYWVWQPAEDWPCHGEVMTAMVTVDTRLGGVRAWAAKMNYGEYLGPESSKYGFWNSALWLGPIAAPSLPTKDQRV